MEKKFRTTNNWNFFITNFIKLKSLDILYVIIISIPRAFNY